jgi:hypothetical protein
MLIGLMPLVANALGGPSQIHPVTAGEPETVSVSGADLSQTTPSGQQYIRVSHEPPKWTDIITAVTAMIVALFTALLAVVSWKQWRLLSRSLDDSAVALEIARRTVEATNSVASGTVMTGAATLDLANAAGRSAEAAQQMLAVSQDTAMRQLRAYLSVTGVDIVYDPENPRRFRAIADVRNGGVTPATALRKRIRIRIDAGDEPREEWLDDDEEMVGAGSVLGPGEIQSIGRGGDSPLGHTVEAYCRAGGVVTVYGFLLYEDIFGASRETRFCAYMSGRTLRAGARFVAASFGNVYD